MKAIRFGVIGYILFMVILFTDHMMSEYLLHYRSVFKDTSDKYDSYLLGFEKEKLILLGIFIVPIVEEIAFRGFMNFKKIYVSLSVGSLGYITLRIFISATAAEEIYQRSICIGIALMIFAITYIRINEQILLLLKNKYRLLFYLSNILFVLLHVSNYNVAEFDLLNYFALPIVLMPQLVASINFSYIRIKNGLAWSIFFHSFYNSIFYLPLLME